MLLGCCDAERRGERRTVGCALRRGKGAKASLERSLSALRLPLDQLKDRGARRNSRLLGKRVGFKLLEGLDIAGLDCPLCLLILTVGL